MKKRLLALLLSIVVIGSVFVGCGEKKDQAKEPQQQGQEQDNEKEEKNPIDSLKKSFEKAGFKIGDNETLAYDMIGATAGEKFKLNDQLIEVYYYDNNKLNDEGKKYLKEAEKGSINFSGLNLPVKYNKKGLVLARFDEHKDKDKILEVFNSFN